MDTPNSFVMGVCVYVCVCVRVCRGGGGVSMSRRRRWVNNRSGVISEGGSVDRAHWIRFIRQYLLKCEWEENFQQRRVSKINSLVSRDEQRV